MFFPTETRKNNISLELVTDPSDHVCINIIVKLNSFFLFIFDFVKNIPTSKVIRHFVLLT